MEKLTPEEWHYARLAFTIAFFVSVIVGVSVGLLVGR